MAILATKRVQIVGLRSERKPILEKLQRFGEMEIINAKKSGKIFRKLNVSSQKQTFERNSEEAKQAAEALDNFKPEQQGLFDKLNGRLPVKLSRFEKIIDDEASIMDLAKEINQLVKVIESETDNIPRIETEIETLRPWRDFDLPLSFEGTRTTTAFIGSLSGYVTDEEINSQLETILGKDFIYQLETISRLEEQTSIMVLVPKEQASMMSDALTKIEFVRAPYSDMNPSEQIKRKHEEIKEARSKIHKAKERIEEVAVRRHEVKAISDYYKLRADKYEVISNIVQSDNVFVLRGYIPEDSIPKLQELLSPYTCELEVQELKKKDNAPIKLKNGPFSRSVEGVVGGFSLPGKGDLDPTFLTALFYYMLFGMMLSDAGYGLLLVLLTTLALWKCKHLEPEMENMVRLFRKCGIATAFWGFMFGSFFGDAVGVVSTTFFHRPDISLGPIWFDPVHETIRMLVFVFLIGVIHLFLGLFTQMYNYLRKGMWKDAIYDDVFWLMFAGGGVCLLLSMSMITEMMGLSFTISGVPQQIAKWVTIIGAVGILFTAGRDSKSWFKRILKGAYGVYGITGYLSDVLSYSRLLALGLATGVIASVFNKIGSLFGASILGVVAFIIVFAIGHTLNFLINVLGAYVHANRLQYVEFYSKFYSGGGRPFEKFNEKTSYYKVEED